MIVSVLMVIISVIIIVKFFQIAADVRVIKNSLTAEEKENPSNSTVDDTKDTSFKVGSHIVEKKTEKQMRIMSIDEKSGKFACSNNNGFTTIHLKEDEIELFETYVKNLKK